MSVVSFLAAVTLAVGLVSPAVAATPSPSPLPAPQASTGGAVAAPLPVKVGHFVAPPSAQVDTGAPAANLVSAPWVAPVILKNPSQSTSFDANKSVPIKYGARETEYQNPDGTTTTAMYPSPVNYLRSDGTWVAAGTTVASSAKGGFSVADNPLAPKFGASTGAGADLSVNSGSDPVTISLEGASTSAAVKPAASELHSVQEGLGLLHG